MAINSIYCQVNFLLHIPIVITIGAGDNFNAGVLYRLYREGIHRKDIPAMTESQWECVLNQATQSPAEVCQSYGNYIGL